MPRPLFLVLAVVLTGGEAAGQEPNELWRWSTDAEITMHTVTPTGDLLVSTSKSTTLLSAESGRVRWVREDVVSCGAVEWRDRSTCRKDGRYEYVSFLGPYLRFESRAPGADPLRRFGRGWRPVSSRSDERFLLVDLETGLDTFDTSALGLIPIQGSCLLPAEGIAVAWGERGDRPAMAVAFDLNNAKRLWTTELPLSRRIMCLPLNGSGTWLAYGESERGTRHVYGIEAATGHMRWENVELASEAWAKSPTAITVSDSTAVVHVDRSGPAKIDFRSGALHWRGDLFRGDQPAAALVRHGDRLFIPREKKLAALDLATGAVLWIRDRFREPAMILDTTRQGLLVRGGALDLLRYESGESVWPRPVRVSDDAWLLHQDTLFFVWDKKLRSLVLDAGIGHDLGAIELAGHELPSHLELLNDAVLVLSSQNIVAFERDGRLRYQQYYSAPGLSLGQALGRIALAGAMTAASYHVARTNAEQAAATASFLRGGRSATIWYLYDVYTPNLGIRYRATTQADQFAYLYTDRPDSANRRGFSLVQLDKRDGRETGRVWSPVRQPDYSIDPFAARVFFKTGNNEITAYAYPRPSEGER
jgi:hypothetical protein